MTDMKATKPLRKENNMIIIEEKPRGIKVGDTLKFKPLPEILAMIDSDWKCNTLPIKPRMIDIISSSVSVTAENYISKDTFFSGEWTWPIAFFEITQGKVVRMSEMKPGDTGVVVDYDEPNYKQHFVLKTYDPKVVDLSGSKVWQWNKYCLMMVRLCDLKLSEV